MEKYLTDDTFLGRWISGELSEEERIAFEKTAAFKEFNFINIQSQSLEGPEVDTEAALQKVQAKIKNNSSQKKPKVIRLWYPAVAAILILAITSVLFLTSSKTYTTGIGEKTTITLADGSTIHLNANSSVSHKRFFWDSNREIHIEGEGYFTITKGDSFKVHTSKGVVAVLGTEFNIRDRKNTPFILKCYDGKVTFTDSKNKYDSQILEKGMSISIKNESLQKEGFEDTTPSWKKGVSSFTNQPLQLVLDELTQYYPITFDAEGIDTQRLFTGSFTHSNLTTALEATLAPMGITYENGENKNSIKLSK